MQDDSKEGIPNSNPDNKTPIPQVFYDAFNEVNPAQQSQKPQIEPVNSGPTYKNSPDLLLNQQGEKVVVQESTGLQQEYDKITLAMVNVERRLGGKLEKVEPIGSNSVRITFRTGQSFVKPVDELI